MPRERLPHCRGVLVRNYDFFVAKLRIDPSTLDPQVKARLDVGRRTFFAGILKKKKNSGPLLPEVLFKRQGVRDKDG